MWKWRLTLFGELEMKISGVISSIKLNPSLVCPRRNQVVTVAFIKGLLEHAGSILDPIRLVKSIPPGMKIEGLKESLIKIFFDHEIQVGLFELHLIVDEPFDWRGKDLCD